MGKWSCEEDLVINVILALMEGLQSYIDDIVHRDCFLPVLASFHVRLAQVRVI